MKLTIFITSFLLLPNILCLVFNDGVSRLNRFASLPTISELECPYGVLGLKMGIQCGDSGYQHPDCPRTLLVQQSLDEGRLVEALQYANTEESRLALDIVLNNGDNYDITDNRLSNCTHMVVEAMIRKKTVDGDKNIPVSNSSSTSAVGVTLTKHPISAYTSPLPTPRLQRRSTIKASCTENSSFGIKHGDYLAFEEIISSQLDMPIVFQKADGNKQRAVIQVGNDITLIAYRIATGAVPELSIRQLIPLVLAGRNSCWPKYNTDIPTSGTTMTAEPSELSILSEVEKSPTITSLTLGLTAYIVQSHWAEYF